jgi:hypothetical protein
MSQHAQVTRLSTTRRRTSRTPRPAPKPRTIESAPVLPPVEAPVNMFEKIEEYTMGLHGEFDFYGQMTGVKDGDGPDRRPYHGGALPYLRSHVELARGVHHAFERPEPREGFCWPGLATLQLVNSKGEQLAKVSVPASPHVQAAIVVALASALDALDPLAAA